MGRNLLWASLAVAPITILVDKLTGAGDVTLFVLAALSLIPLAWLIGESTEHAAEHTGPGIGGFLNASFGNAPELIVALFAVGANLPEVVRGSLSGSVISNLLLVYGVTQIAGTDGARIDRRSLLLQIGLIGVAVVAFVAPATLGYTGAPERNAVVIASVPVAIVLLLLYLAVVGRNLRRHHESERARGEPSEGTWSLLTALAVLAVATAVTAWISEILVHSLGAFAEAVGLSEFFIAVVIVAIVGNAAEHGGAIVIAHNGKMRLATEIAISSAAQVGLLVVPVVTLLSLLFSNHLALAFRWTELFAMAGAAVVVAATVWDGTSRRKEGAFLVAAYAAAVVGFLLGGGR
ncbi:MAG TPA: calcium/proton exchanger [Gaiellaceae bacterium]|nr:calcium/proton exchanger [Gaiellaceae bacterium]